jgi:8-oxo-dGTP pyrophosphatase MutT (NUDIX family)
MILPPALAGLEHALLPIDLEPEPLEDPAQHSAVLVLLYPWKGEPHFVLTRRRDDLTRHPGQISLPGGVVEQHDASLWETALRECREEVALRSGRLQPLGRLDPYHLRVSQYVIHPFVAWSPVRPSLTPDDREVAEILEEPLALLTDPSQVAQETWEFREKLWLVTHYRLGDAKVWGATAHILSDLAGRLDADWRARSPRPGDVVGL